MATEERRNRRQIDRMEIMIGEILTLMNGHGETLGLKDKVNIMWSYRILFMGSVATVIVSAVTASVAYLIRSLAGV